MAWQIKNLEINEERILVVAPIGDRMEKLFLLQKILREKDILVFLGDSCFPYAPGENASEIVKRLNEISTFFEGKGICYYLLGDKDITFKGQVASSNTDADDWLGCKPLGVRFTYRNQSTVLVLHGGILPIHAKLADLNDPEVAFINTPWHKGYNGRFGFMVSAHPVSDDGKIKKGKHSMSIDTKCYETGILAVQELNKNGVGETFYL